MAIVTGMEIQKRHPDRVNLELDGEFAFGLAGILAAGLKVGQTLTTEQAAALQQKDAEEAAYQGTLRLLSLRPRSESELRAYLRKHKTPDEVIQRTLARLREHEHANDVRFASLWVENRAAFRPRGRRLLAWELRQKGVAAGVAEQALSEVDEQALAHQAGLKRARQLSTADWQDFRSKVSAYLARRGFPSSIITETVSRLWTETHAGQPSIQEEDIR